MNFRNGLAASAALLSLAWAATPAHANGLGVEGNYARANGDWGAELGAGYGFDFQGFRLTPGAGLYLRDGDTEIYGRLELSYQLPASLRVGAGLRISDEDPRPYATVAIPFLTNKAAIKGNLGYKYAAVGLTLGF